MDFPHYGDPLAEIGHIWGFWALSGECGSKCRGEGGGIFPTLCVECCLVDFNYANHVYGVATICHKVH